MRWKPKTSLLYFYGSAHCTAFVSSCLSVCLSVTHSVRSVLICITQESLNSSNLVVMLPVYAISALSFGSEKWSLRQTKNLRRKYVTTVDRSIVRSRKDRSFCRTTGSAVLIAFWKCTLPEIIDDSLWSRALSLSTWATGGLRRALKARCACASNYCRWL